MIYKRVFIFLFVTVLFIFGTKEVLAQVTINEFVPDAEQEWVEFYNASDSAQYLKNYWIDDDPTGGQAKKQLTTLNIDNPKFPYFVLGSSYLNNNGDKIILYDELNNIVSQYEYSSIPSENYSIGRYPDQTGNFAFLQSATKGAANSTIKIDPTPSTTPTPATTKPSPTPTPTATALATKSPTPKATKSPTAKPSETPQSLVLGQQDREAFGPTSSPNPLVTDEQTTEGSYIPPIALLFILAGCGLVGISILSFFKFRQNSYNDLDENSILRPKN